MKKTPTTKSSRRKFLSLSLLGSAAFIVPDSKAEQSPDQSETIKMLSPDGKLVEVSKEAFTLARKNRKASNAEILQWSKTINTTKK
jgi:hypothetical protein